MILKKIVIDGKEVYMPISREEVLEQGSLNGLVFTDEDEREELEDLLEDLLEEQEEEREEQEEEDEVEDEEEEQETHREEQRERRRSFAFGGDGTLRLGKLFAMLPFMDDEDIHDCVQSILEQEGSCRGVALVGMMPFLEEEDCDALLLKYVADNADKPRCSIAALAPFVSDECLSKIVDGYLDGKYQNLSLESLYPFLPERDVRRLFEHYAAKRKNHN